MKTNRDATLMRSTFDYATKIKETRNSIKRYYEKYNEPFTEKEQEQLEKFIITKIKDREISRKSDISKLVDIAKKDVKSFKNLIKEGKKSINEVFTETDARVEKALREIDYRAGFFT